MTKFNLTEQDDALVPGVKQIDEKTLNQLLCLNLEAVKELKNQTENLTAQIADMSAVMVESVPNLTLAINSLITELKELDFTVLARGSEHLETTVDALEALIKDLSVLSAWIRKGGSGDSGHGLIG